MKDLSSRDERIEYETEEKRIETFHCPLCPLLGGRDPEHEVDKEGTLVGIDARYKSGYQKDDHLEAKALNMICRDCADIAFGYDANFNTNRFHIRRALDNYVTTDNAGSTSATSRYLFTTLVLMVLCGLSGVIIGYEGALTTTEALAIGGLSLLSGLSVMVFAAILSRH